jgi:hypothetical protein
MKTALRMFAVSLLSLAALAATIRIEPKSSLASPAGVVNVNVTVEDVTGLYAYQFDLAFDSSVLSATAVTEGDFLRRDGGATFFIAGTIDNTLGTIAFTVNTLLGPEPGVTGTGSLATVQFRGIDVGMSGVTLSNAVLLNSLGNDITAELEHGSVTVVPEPGSTLLVLTAAGALFVLRLGRDIARGLPARRTFGAFSAFCPMIGLGKSHYRLQSRPQRTEPLTRPYDRCMRWIAPILVVLLAVTAFLFYKTRQIDNALKPRVQLIATVSW